MMPARVNETNKTPTIATLTTATNSPSFCNLHLEPIFYSKHNIQAISLSALQTQQRVIREAGGIERDTRDADYSGRDFQPYQ